MNYVKVEFEEEGDVYEYMTTDVVLVGDYVFVVTPSGEAKNVKVVKVQKEPVYKGKLKWCQLNQLALMETTWKLFS